MKEYERRCQGYTIEAAVRVDMHTEKIKGKIVTKLAMMYKYEISLRVKLSLRNRRDTLIVCVA